MTDRMRPPHDDAQTEPRPRETRRRGQALIDAIHQAVLAEVGETGIAGLTMEGIARRAGTAKTSLYRRWAATEDILIAALYRRYPQEEPSPGADDLRGDLIQALSLLRDLSRDETMGAAMAAVFIESAYRPHLRERLLNEVYDPRGHRFTRTVLQHYAEQGKVDPARVTQVTVDIGEALILKYLMDHFVPPGDEYVTEIVDKVILPAIGQDPN